MGHSKANQTGETGTTGRPFAEHSRHWESYKYVYPVVSRRSRGLSIGINLNPDTICNFDCVYCQVKKAEHPSPQPVDLDQLRAELTALLDAVINGDLWEHARFAAIDPTFKRLNDIAFSGDGEPTSCKAFPDAVDMAIDLKQSRGLNDTKIILITNATLLGREHVEQAIQVMDQNQGEVWAKLDAGTDAYYQQVDRSAVPFQKILDNILACGRRRPIVIQSMFAKLHDTPIPEDEFSAYTQRIAELLNQGCRIKSIQLYTIARQPLESFASALSDETLIRMTDRLRDTVPGIPVHWFGAHG